VKPGARFDRVHDAARRVMVDALVSIGLLKGRASTIIKKDTDARFVLHKTSHWLGRDVHDRGRYADAEGQPRLLVPGMVLTVEPGLYVRPDEEGVPPRFRGLGVRIEDDVLVTENGSRVLTAGVPKARGEVEALVGRARG
jgi:Xaa-Pro aminopeptidase